MSQPASPRRIIILAGPNGTGKTTFACHFLLREADCPEFINADLIAQGVSPFAPERAALEAGEIMLNLIDEKTRRGESFAFETTLAGRSYIHRIPQWRKLGYHVKLIFRSLPSADLAVSRVKDRVSRGGHDVPQAVVRRRFDLGIRNFNTIYRKLVNSWVRYDNAGPQPVLLEHGEEL